MIKTINIQSPEQIKKRFSFLKPKQFKEICDSFSKKFGYNVYESINPINPLLIERTHKEPTEQEIQWLKEWDSVVDSVYLSVEDSVEDSVWDSVWASVWDPVCDSVWASAWPSVRNSVWASVEDSVRASVRNSVVDSIYVSVGAYVSSLFPNIEKWEGIDHEPGVNPFQSGINLWESGLMPSYDGKKWRLHGGKDAEVVYEVEL